MSDIYAEVQPLITRLGKPSGKARLWVCRRGQKPTETVFTHEPMRLEIAEEIAALINRPDTRTAEAHP